MPVKRTEWVQQVVGDALKPSTPVVVDGYIGDSPEPEHVRIYLDSRLTRYVDVPESAVRHQEDIADSTPAGLQRIWLNPDAEIKTAPQTMTAKFLEGNVAQTYAARAQQEQAATLRIDPSWIDGCPSLQNPDICPPWTTIINQTFGIVCQSRVIICETRLTGDCLPEFTPPVLESLICTGGSCVDGCESALGCSVACDFTDFTRFTDWTGQTPIINERVRRFRGIGRRGLSRF